jgi:hypothetical protein
MIIKMDGTRGRHPVGEIPSLSDEESELVKDVLEFLDWVEIECPESIWDLPFMRCEPDPEEEHGYWHVTEIPELAAEQIALGHRFALHHLEFIKKSSRNFYTAFRGIHADMEKDDRDGAYFIQYGYDDVMSQAIGAAARTYDGEWVRRARKHYGDADRKSISCERAYVEREANVRSERARHAANVRWGKAA